MHVTAAWAMRADPSFGTFGMRSKGSLGPVMVIDDEPDIQTFIRLAPEDEGYDVLTASDGAGALDLLYTARPSIILLDLRMPGMDGQTFVETYRARATADERTPPL